MKKLFGFLMSFLLVFSVMTPLTTTSAAELKQYKLEFDKMTTESLKGQYGLKPDGAGETYEIVDHSTDEAVPEEYKNVLCFAYDGNTLTKETLKFNLPEEISGPVRISLRVLVTPSGSYGTLWNSNLLTCNGGSGEVTIIKQQGGNLFTGLTSGFAGTTITEATNGTWANLTVQANTNTSESGHRFTNLYVKTRETGDGKIETEGKWYPYTGMGVGFPCGEPLRHITLCSEYTPKENLAGKTYKIYYDDITIEEIDPAEMMKLESSSVKDGDTDVAWAGFIALNFDREVYPESLAEIKLRQGEKDIKILTAIDTNDPKRVIISPATLTSNEDCELIIPATVSGKDGMQLEKDQIIHFTPSEKFKMDLNFEDMATNTIDSCNNGGTRVFCMYANHAFETTSQGGPLTEGSENKYEVISDEDGNHFLRTTAVGQKLYTKDGKETTFTLGGYFINFDDTKLLVMAPDGDYTRVYSFRFRVSGDTSGTYMQSLLTSTGGPTGMLTSNGGKFGAGWVSNYPGTYFDTLNEKKDGVPRYANGEWCTVRYVIEPNKDKATVIVNEGESDEAIYENVDIGSLNTGVSYYRFIPGFSSLAVGKKIEFDFDDFVAKYVPAPATDTLVLTDAALEGEVKGGSTVTVKGTFANGTAEAQKPQMVAAVYNEGGELLSATIVSQSILSKDTVDVPAKLTIPADAGESAYVKVFGFDSFDLLKPLGAAVELK